MSYTLDFLPIVYEDIQESYDWYQEQLSGLEEDFLRSIHAAVDQIVQHPLGYTRAYKTVRKVNLKRFPYGVFYKVVKREITVIAIIHLARHPRTWRGRV